MPPSGQRRAAPRLDRPGRADDDDAIAVPDLVVPAREDRLVAADDRRHLRVLGNLGVAQRDAHHGRRRGVVDLELADLHLPVGEDVGLSRRRDAEDAADGVRRLELGRDDEVDVELPFAPEVDVLDARGADDGRRAPRRLAPREHAGDEVHLVAGGAGDDEIGGLNAGGGEILPARPVALEHGDVVARGHGLQAGCLGVEHRDLVVLVEGFDDGRADLAGADEEDPHERVAYFGSRRAYTRRLPWPRAARPRRRGSPLGRRPRNGVRLRAGRGEHISQGGLRTGLRLDPVLLTYAPGEPRTRLRRRAAGTRDPHARWTANRSSWTSATASSTAESRVCSASRSILATRPTTGSTWPTPSRTGFNTVARYRADGARALPSTRKILLAVRDPYGNHNGGNLVVRAGRSACTRASATAGREAIPRTGRRTCSRSSGSS